MHKICHDVSQSDLIQICLRYDMDTSQTSVDFSVNLTFGYSFFYGILNHSCLILCGIKDYDLLR